jgi:hypothetical protein
MNKILTYEGTRITAYIRKKDYIRMADKWWEMWKKRKNGGIR